MKNKAFFLKLLLFFISIGIVISSVKISSILDDYKKSINTYNNIISSAVSEQKGDGGLNKSPSLFIDFEGLQKMNSDIVGWLYCEDTIINYPVVLGTNNEYYLNHLPDNTYSSSGTLFIDSRNTLSDKHILIYGHKMKNGTMFGDLNEYSSQSYYEEHPSFTFYTGNGEYKLRIYSAYYTNDGDFTYSLTDRTDASEYAYYAKAHSCISTDVEFNKNDGIITLSTCAYLQGYNRFVVQCIPERIK